MLSIKGKDPFSDLPPLLSEQVIADALQVPLSRVRTWRRSGRLGPFFQAGAKRLMCRDTFTNWVRSRES